VGLLDLLLQFMNNKSLNSITIGIIKLHVCAYPITNPADNS
jgi:hypothetical protein